MYDIDAWIFSVVFGNVPAGQPEKATTTPNDHCSRFLHKADLQKEVARRVILGATLDEPAKIVKNDTKHFRKDVMKKAPLLFWRDGTPHPKCRIRGPVVS